MRRCGGCDLSKPTTAFYCRNGKPYGPCKSCRREVARSRRQAEVGELQYLRTIVAAVQAQVPYLGGDLA